MVSAQRKQDIVSPSVRDLRDQSTGHLSDPAHHLIASDRVEGTKVFRPNGDRIGKIEHFMFDKRSGQVEYAVMSFGGFLGLGEEFRPLPWGALEYDDKLEGYVVAAEDDTLRNSPFIEGTTAPEWDSAYAKMLYRYWGMPY
ncbi:PRC-barrel domain containing protein [Altererythrobacter sp. BO-6]|uniref:PRC-barrel domain-containing protein n=1 Tax=Altererythrobacter sp. BO-6 TaxID=2604537 RepID=UPI0013E16DBF|nr:PRC-barrel domain-containing protein [Altererythrobacter sp. BO-6]QIG52967.1 PRC-barrel domain containing protein [Altererythrobacter sp. BO-6]